MEQTFSPTVQTGALQTPTAGELIASGQTVQQIQTSYATAVSVQKPRNILAVQDKCLNEATLSGDRFFYRWESETEDKFGKKKKSVIIGPSFDLSMAVARLFGNIAVTQKPIQETRESWIFTAAFVDLETGFTLERTFRMSKNWKVYGNFDVFRKEDIRFQIGQSKAMRNVVVNAVPSFLVDKMIEAALNSVRGEIEKKLEANKGNIVAVINKALDECEKLGVTRDRVVAKAGYPIEQWGIDDLVALAGDYRALKQGREKADTLFPDPSTYNDSESDAGATQETQPDDKPFNATNGDAAQHQDVKSGKAKGGELF